MHAIQNKQREGSQSSVFFFLLLFFIFYFFIFRYAGCSKQPKEQISISET